MRCIDCAFYLTEEDTRDEPGCINDGDGSDPEEDINCAEAGDEEIRVRTN